MSHIVSLCNFEKETKDSKQFVQPVITFSGTAAKKKLATTEDVDKKAMYSRLIGQVEEAAKTLQGVALVDASKDVLMEWLDAQFGSQVCSKNLRASLTIRYTHIVGFSLYADPINR